MGNQNWFSLLYLVYFSVVKKGLFSKKQREKMQRFFLDIISFSMYNISRAVCAALKKSTAAQRILSGAVEYVRQKFLHAYFI